MEDYNAVISRLKEEIKSRDEDVHLAATYGKQLVEEKIKLAKNLDDDVSQKELLEQEKHSLRLELETQIQTVKSQSSELEIQRDEVDKLMEKIQYLTKEKELQKALSQMQYKVETAKKKENQLLKRVKDLEEAVSDRDCKIRGYSAEIKKMKEEIEELQGEIVIFKFEQVDTKKPGNSVFAELVDRRTLVEKEYNELARKFELCKRKYEAKKTELDMARGRMLILQNMASREYQQTYIDILEDNLTSVRKEVSELIHKLSEALKCYTEVPVEDQDFSRRNEYDYLRAKLKQSQNKGKELETEVLINLQKFILTQHVLHNKNEELDSAKQEISKLKLKIKEMEKGVFEKDRDDPVSRKPMVDVFENFKPLTNNGKLSALKIPELPDVNIIPGEIELDEDGFRQTRKPRKSNEFILTEFNQIKEEDNEDSSVAREKTESVQIINEELEKGVHKEIPSYKYINRSKISSHSKNDRCAQQ